ncbi:hypothetical protein [uncultured Sphingomonas sp.]|uniref:hypothetical protein n=1 Tax=uncultured Sphingomonas sp. TaxID=158754 RepID=UPI0025DDB216|nr:hypothetical protein [uncultured Sphingomonas sp.]
MDGQHLRLFIVSHLCGPLIGLALAALMVVLGFPLDSGLQSFAVLVCLFWAYPAALAAGARYWLLSLVSLQHLTVVILLASHEYGGFTSPFLLWLAVVPLLAFLYSAPSVRLWAVLIGLLGLNTGLFAVVTANFPAPPPVDPNALHGLALVSLLSACTYVSMMAGYLGRVLSSRNEMAEIVAQRSAAAASLDRRSGELRQMRTARVASLSRLVRGCRPPVSDILSSCEQVIENAPAHRRSSDISDLLSIKAAAARLADHVEEIDRYRTGLTGTPSDARA